MFYYEKCKKQYCNKRDYLCLDHFLDKKLCLLNLVGSGGAKLYEIKNEGIVLSKQIINFTDGFVGFHGNLLTVNPSCVSFKSFYSIGDIISDQKKLINFLSDFLSKKHKDLRIFYEKNKNLFEQSNSLNFGDEFHNWLGNFFNFKNSDDLFKINYYSKYNEMYNSPINMVETTLTPTVNFVSILSPKFQYPNIVMGKENIDKSIFGYDLSIIYLLCKIYSKANKFIRYDFFINSKNISNNLDNISYEDNSLIIFQICVAVQSENPEYFTKNIVNHIIIWNKTIYANHLIEEIHNKFFDFTTNYNDNFFEILIEDICDKRPHNQIINSLIFNQKINSNINCALPFYYHANFYIQMYVKLYYYYTIVSAPISKAKAIIEINRKVCPMKNLLVKEDILFIDKDQFKTKENPLKDGNIILYQILDINTHKKITYGATSDHLADLFTGKYKDVEAFMPLISAIVESNSIILYINGQNPIFQLTSDKKLPTNMNHYIILGTGGHFTLLYFNHNVQLLYHIENTKEKSAPDLFMKHIERLYEETFCNNIINETSASWIKNDCGLISAYNVYCLVKNGGNVNESFFKMAKQYDHESFHNYLFYTSIAGFSIVKYLDYGIDNDNFKPNGLFEKEFKKKWGKRYDNKIATLEPNLVKLITETETKLENKYALFYELINFRLNIQYNKIDISKALNM